MTALPNPGRCGVSASKEDTLIRGYFRFVPCPQRHPYIRDPPPAKTWYPREHASYVLARLPRISSVGTVCSEESWIASLNSESNQFRSTFGCRGRTH